MPLPRPSFDRSVTIDYHVISSTGAVMRTYGDRDLAIKAAKKLEETFPGCRVEEVETSVSRRSVYRPRTALRVVGGGC